MASCRKVIERSICLTQLSQHQCFFSSLMTTAANTRCTETLLIWNSHELLNSLCASSILGCFHAYSTFGAHPDSIDVRVRMMWALFTELGCTPANHIKRAFELWFGPRSRCYCAMRQGLLQFILPQPWCQKPCVPESTWMKFCPLIICITTPIVTRKFKTDPRSDLLLRGFRHVLICACGWF